MRNLPPPINSYTSLAYFKGQERLGVEWVYFIQDEHGSIKIGRTKDILRRLKSLQTDSAYELRLLAKVEGALQTEMSLHERFAAYRLRGEWFKPAEELLAYIERLKRSADVDAWPRVAVPVNERA